MSEIGGLGAEGREQAIANLWAAKEAGMPGASVTSSLTASGGKGR